MRICHDQMTRMIYRVTTSNPPHATLGPVLAIFPIREGIQSIHDEPGGSSRLSRIPYCTRLRPVRGGQHSQRRVS